MVSKALLTNKTDLWSTPDDFYERLDKLFAFSLDPCANAENAKCVKFFTEDDDGLKQDWSGFNVFINPPYSKTKDWVKKAYEESKKENTTCVMLIASRTDTRVIHDYVFKYAAQIVFIKGRLKFGGSSNSAPFPSMVVVFDHDHTKSNKEYAATYSTMSNK